MEDREAEEALHRLLEAVECLCVQLKRQNDILLRLVDELAPVHTYFQPSAVMVRTG